MKFKDVLNEGKNKYMTLYHGTHYESVSKIQKDGIIPERALANWYMLASDIESAIFHSIPDENFSYVFELKIPVLDNDDQWDGYPYIWPENKRSSKSSWYGIKTKIPKKFIVKLHKISIEKYEKQKNEGF